MRTYTREELDVTNKLEYYLLKDIATNQENSETVREIGK